MVQSDALVELEEREYRQQLVGAVLEQIRGEIPISTWRQFEQYGLLHRPAVDVARESADIVLLRPDLNAIRRGVEDGRRTFANTLKYIAITISANFGNMVSMALATDYNMSKTTDCEGAYAGCMTAGCRFRPGETPAKGSLVECDCPIVTGKYQIGQTGADVTCAIPSQGSTNFVWSAAYTVEHGDPEAQH